MADRGYRGRPQRGERADRQINAGHSRGLDAALSDTEAKIRKLKTERIYAFNKDGKEIAHSQTGKAHSTQLPFGYNYKDAIITHNHPNRGIGDTIAGRVGTILSGADIFTTIAHNASEIRAVTKNYTYSLKSQVKGGDFQNRMHGMFFVRKIRNGDEPFSKNRQSIFQRAEYEIE